MTNSQAILHHIQEAKRIVVMQADNPDADSLASSLALEQILGDMGKEPYLYCGVDIPTYLRYLSGWDRVNKELPTHFDLSIIVDTSAIDLFDSLSTSGNKKFVAAKPSIVIDHHDVEPTIDFAAAVWNRPAVATGEVIYELAREHKWPLNLEACNMIAVAILSDSLGLTSEATTARSIHIVGELVERGVQLAQLDNMRRNMMRKSPELIRYKGELLQRVEYFDNDRIATVTIPWKEIERYSHAYNPSMLVLDEMRWTERTDVAIAFKLYRDGKITAKIRTNYGKAIAGELAAAFGGGGHPYASGFKVTDGTSFDEIKSKCIALASELLDTVQQEGHHEAI